MLGKHYRSCLTYAAMPEITPVRGIHTQPRLSKFKAQMELLGSPFEAEQPPRFKIKAQFGYQVLLGSATAVAKSKSKHTVVVLGKHTRPRLSKFKAQMELPGSPFEAERPPQFKIEAQFSQLVSSKTAS